MTCRWPRRLSPKRLPGSSAGSPARRPATSAGSKARLSGGDFPSVRNQTVAPAFFDGISRWWAGRMLRTHDYFARAEQHLRLAEQASDCRRKALHLKLAQLYLSLVELRQKNAATDLTYETPPSERPGSHQLQNSSPSGSSKKVN